MAAAELPRDRSPVVAPAPKVRDETPNPARAPLRCPHAVILFTYGIVLALIAFWPTHVDEGATPLLRLITRAIPLLTYPRIEFLANIVVFVPLGLLLTLILGQARWLALPISFLATVTIEGVQAVLLNARTPSILDIIANTAGACVGILIAVLVEAHSRRRARRYTRG
ncbi:VanZ family protein [Microbacterium aurum]